MGQGEAIAVVVDLMNKRLAPGEVNESEYEHVTNDQCQAAQVETALTRMAGRRRASMQSSDEWDDSDDSDDDGHVGNEKHSPDQVLKLLATLSSDCSTRHLPTHVEGTFTPPVSEVPLKQMTAGSSDEWSDDEEEDQPVNFLKRLVEQSETIQDDHNLNPNTQSQAVEAALASMAGQRRTVMESSDEWDEEEDEDESTESLKEEEKRGTQREHLESQPIEGNPSPW